jgi:hypothetical protein
VLATDLDFPIRDVDEAADAVRALIDVIDAAELRQGD